MNLNRIFTEQNLHNISAIIADTSRGLTKSELERHLRESKITLVSDGSFNNGLYYKIGLNKRDWLYNCLANEINSTHNFNKVIEFIEIVTNPVNYTKLEKRNQYEFILEELNKRKPVFIEMGLQTSHDSTASFLNRAYPTETFTKTCHALAEAGIRVTAHIILGLPGETLDMELDTIRYLNTLPVSGIKISMLYVLKNTVLASYYEQHPFHILTMEEYINHLIICLSQLRKDIVIERMTGDGPKDLLIVPKWIGHKRLVLNTIHKEMKQRNFTQGGSLCQKNL